MACSDIPSRKFRLRFALRSKRRFFARGVADGAEPGGIATPVDANRDPAFLPASDLVHLQKFTPAVTIVGRFWYPQSPISRP
jgi:hypothetical protein